MSRIAKLPAGFRQVEYIQSSGEQYIDTGFKPNNNTRLVLSANNDSSSSAWVYGAWNGANNAAFGLLVSGIYYGTTSASVTVSTGNLAVDHNRNAYSVNGTVGTITAQTFTCNYPIYLFALNNIGSPSGGRFYGKLYSCQIYDNGTLIRDYVPCINPSGEAGLYDLVYGVFYGNAGSGTALIAGPKLITIAPPRNLAAVITEAGVILTWDAEEKAIGYKVYRDKTNLAYTAETSYTDGTAKPNNNYVYGVSAYNAETETAATEITVFVEAPYSPLELITDRTREALERVIELSGKDYMTEMSAEEQEEWRDGMKGAYNASDLNRVEKAVDALAKLLRELITELKGYAAQNQIGWDAFYAPPFDPDEMHPTTKRNWTVRDIPAPADMERYLSNIKLLRSALAYNTDALPATMENLTLSGANAIEKALFALDGAIIIFSTDMRMMIDKAVAARFYSDEIYSGEV